jgi:hypothetical protein
MKGLPVRILLAFAMLSMGLIGCVASVASLRPTPPMTLHTDEKEMRAEVLRHLSIGMPIEEAKKIMDNHGFKCQYGKGSSKDSIWFADPEAEVMGLFCSKFVPQRTWWERFFFSDEIHVRIPIEDGKVKDIVVHHIPLCL